MLFLLTLGLYQLSKQEKLDQELFQIQHDLSTNKTVGLLYLEYCLDRVTDRRHCLFSKPFFMLKKSGDSSTTDDLGVEYLGTKHFRDFYKKLIDRSSEVTHLHHFRAYEQLVEESIQRIKATHKKFFAVSYHNQNVLSYFFGLFKSSGYVEIYIILLILYFVGGFIERYILSRNFLFITVLAAVILIKIESLFYPYDSLETVGGASILGAFILGAGVRTRYYVEAFRIKKIKIYRSIVLLIFFIGSVALYFVIYPDTSSLRIQLISFLSGFLLLFFFDKIRLLPYGFETYHEFAKWQWLKKHLTQQQFDKESIKMLEKNPYLKEIKIYLFEHKLIKNEQDFSTLLKTCKYEKTSFFKKNSSIILEASRSFQPLFQSSFLESHYSLPQLRNLIDGLNKIHSKDYHMSINLFLAYYHLGGKENPSHFKDKFIGLYNEEINLKKLIDIEDNILAKNFLYQLSDLVKDL